MAAFTDWTVRAAVRGSTGILWANYLLTARWAHVDGSLHGPKEPWYLAALTMLTLAAWWPARRRAASAASSDSAIAIGVTRVLCAAGVAAMIGAFLVWFPPATWIQIPFLDDWPPRYQSTREFIARIQQGTVAGWEWAFLGGYHTSSDVTQSLGPVAWMPMLLLGDALGFHLTHLLLLLAIPALLWWDLRLAERPAVAWLGAALGAWAALNYSYFLIRSGDTNSLAGVVLTLAALVGAHAARQGRRWGAPWLVTSLVLVAWSHAGSFAYAALYLALDAAIARDRRSALRAAIGVAAALLAALPVTWESWRYASLFSFNNVFYVPPASVDWPALLRKVGYNIELLWLPGRWFNDYGGLALVFLPIAVVTAWRDRGRVQLYAAGWLLTVALMRLNDPHFGYAFLRPIHMFVIFAAPVLAAAVVRAWSRPVAWSLLATVVLFVQIWWQPVPHVRSIREFDAALTDRVAAAEGALVLVETNPHRNTNAEPGGTTAPSRFGTHFESLLAEATGRRLYAGMWDGWQWNPWKGEMLGGGTLLGRGLGSIPASEFLAEMDRWGVVDLFVWSDVSRAYIRALPGVEESWASDAWTQFTRRQADGREVVTTSGSAQVRDRSVRGGIVALSNVDVGSPVTVRTHYHPSWQARTLGGTPERPVETLVRLVDRIGQLSFVAPCTTCDVELIYPRRLWLVLLALAAWVAGAWGAARVRSPTIRFR